MENLEIILKDILNNNLDNQKNINLIEIGAAFGDNSTKILYNSLKSNTDNFNFISYEGSDSFEYAKKLWNDEENITLINEYFCKKDDINNLLIPNIPDYIVDYKESGERIKKSREKILNNTNFFTQINIIPDIVFIDCSRFMHLPIISLCNELFSNKLVYYIMEDDYYHDNIFGELEIIKKYFTINIVKIYNYEKHQWPFVVFNIVN